MKAWHFVGERLRDGRSVPPDGEWLEHDGELVMCESGLHASKRIIDALQYAPGSTICRVEVDGEIIEDDDKLVATRRKILWRVDGEELLREFARWCALQVIDLWDAPHPVRQYLETGDEILEDAARDAASATARIAARAVAWAASRAAASAASRAASTAASTAAAWDASSAAARIASRAVAWDAAWDDARDAAWDDARDAAWDASRDASRAAQNEKLDQMVRSAAEGGEDLEF